MIGERLLNKLTFRKLRKLCRLIEKTGSVYLSGESLGIPRTSLQDLLSTGKALLEAGIITDKQAGRAIKVFKVISVSHARWSLNTLNNIQYGGLADARRSNAVLYLLQTFKPLDFPKTSLVSSNEGAQQLIATLRAISTASTGENAPQEIDNSRAKQL